MIETKACTKVFFNIAPPDEEIEFIIRKTSVTQSYRQRSFFSNSKKSYGQVLQQLLQLKRILIDQNNTNLKKRKPDYDPLQPQNSPNSEK